MIKQVFIFIGLAISLLSSSCGNQIDFSSKVMQVSDSQFLSKIEVTDDNHFIYSDQKPSVVFIYSDYVEHCRQQAKIFNEIADLYSDKVYFYAIEDSHDSQVLQIFGDNGKRPIYLFVNIKNTQKVSVDKITLLEMQNFIYQAFGIRPTQKP